MGNSFSFASDLISSSSTSSDIRGVGISFISGAFGSDQVRRRLLRSASLYSFCVFFLYFSIAYSMKSWPFDTNVELGYLLSDF